MSLCNWKGDNDADGRIHWNSKGNDIKLAGIWKMYCPHSDAFSHLFFSALFWSFCSKKRPGERRGGSSRSLNELNSGSQELCHDARGKRLKGDDDADARIHQSLALEEVLLPQWESHSSAVSSFTLLNGKARRVKDEKQKRRRRRRSVETEMNWTEGFGIKEFKWMKLGMWLNEGGQWPWSGRFPPNSRPPTQITE